ncbi:MAG: YbaK/EbsC family protein [Chloroflexota bacterium]
MTLKNLNSIRLLQQKKIAHTVHEFPDTLHNAEDVADFIGVPSNQVYKTLVVQRTKPKTKPLLIMIAADRQLNLKKVAKAVNEKKVQMATQDIAEKLTDLQVGGISALMLLNKGFDIYIDETAKSHQQIVISAGQRGINLEIAVDDIIKITSARLIEATNKPPV